MGKGFYNEEAGKWVSDKRARQKAGPQNAWGGYYKTKSKSGNWYQKRVPQCPVCGENMVYRKGPYGEFWGCSKYPKCKGTRQMD